jgi:hemoglobin
MTFLASESALLRTARLLVASLILASAALAAGNARADDALFQQLGGKPGITQFTNTFVQRISEDPRIKDFFADTDLQRLSLLLSEQFCDLSGGPCQYKGRDMREAHKNMGVRTAHFNALAENLQIAMAQHGVPNRAAGKLIALLAPMHGDVVRPMVGQAAAK